MFDALVLADHLEHQGAEDKRAARRETSQGAQRGNNGVFS